jgi:hypothetical protein
VARVSGTADFIVGLLAFPQIDRISLSRHIRGKIVGDLRVPYTVHRNGVNA